MGGAGGLGLIKSISDVSLFIGFTEESETLNFLNKDRTVSYLNYLVGLLFEYELFKEEKTTS